MYNTKQSLCLPLERFVKFKTRKWVTIIRSYTYAVLISCPSRGRKVTSLGVLFDFTGNDKNTTVQKVEDMVKEQWFSEAIKDEPDFFLLVG